MVVGWQALSVVDCPVCLEQKPGFYHDVMGLEEKKTSEVVESVVALVAQHVICSDCFFKQAKRCCPECRQAFGLPETLPTDLVALFSKSLSLTTRQSSPEIGAKIHQTIEDTLPKYKEIWTGRNPDSIQELKDGAGEMVWQSGNMQIRVTTNAQGKYIGLLVVKEGNVMQEAVGTYGDSTS
ncbi:MAG: hypothetical protein HY069_02270 [Chlamydiia bacterium]|nr:hypothetical protein [Chlamydiia bacterium]